MKPLEAVICIPAKAHLELFQDVPVSFTVQAAASNEEIALHRKYNEFLTHDPLSDTLEPDARRRYFLADDAYFSATRRRIDINEGNSSEGNARRSCFRQSQLWLSYAVLRLPNAAEAALPGCSLHNYGLAIDVVGINPTMRTCLITAGFEDDVAGEDWHFSCTGSSAYANSRNTIRELREGVAAEWGEHSKIGFNLMKQRDSLYKSLEIRASKYEGDARLFNAELSKFNRNRSRFEEETASFPERRDSVAGLIGRVHEVHGECDQAAVLFREISDKVIEVLENDIAELRRLRVQAPLVTADEIASRLSRLPVQLKSEYVKSHQRLLSSLARFEEAIAIASKVLKGFQGSLDPFEKRAAELLDTHLFLSGRRKELASEKSAIESGYTNVQLMGTEAMWRMAKAGELLETIQARVDAVST